MHKVLSVHPGSHALSASGRTSLGPLWLCSRWLDGLCLQGILSSVYGEFDWLLSVIMDWSVGRVVAVNDESCTASVVDGGRGYTSTLLVRFAFTLPLLVVSMTTPNDVDGASLSGSVLYWRRCDKD